MPVPVVDAALHRLMDDVDDEEEAHAGLGQTGLPRSLDAFATSDYEDEDAEIDIIRRSGVAPMAVLRHPSGAEATLDLTTSCLSSWRRADGLLAPGAVPLMWPSKLVGGDVRPGSAPSVLPRPWRLTLLDDSNNEPSVTLSCGGDGSPWPWHLRRELTLGATFLREQLWIEHLASGSAEARFEVRERPSEDAPALDTPLESVTLAPGTSWTAMRTWSSAGRQASPRTAKRSGGAP